MSNRDTEITGLRFAKALAWFVYAVIVAAEIILAIAFFLLLLGANPTAPFAEWIYRATGHLMEPFRGIFGAVQADANDSVLDLSILFAMFIYGVVALLLDALVHWLDGKLRHFKAKQFYEETAAPPGTRSPGTRSPADQAPGAQSAR